MGVAGGNPKAWLFFVSGCVMAERLRGRRAQQQRQRRLADQPLCQICSTDARPVPSTAPDHIVPLAKGGSDDDDNIRCICAACHARVTAEQFGHQRRAGMGACDASGLPTDPGHPWAAALGRA
jgi:5-methylcytosine-specific restriction protein A